MSHLDRDMEASVRAMDAGRLRYGALSEQFQAECMAGNWPATERLRFEVVTAVEGYLDAMAAAYRRMEIAKATQGR